MQGVHALLAAVEAGAVLAPVLAALAAQVLGSGVVGLQVEVELQAMTDFLFEVQFLGNHLGKICGQTVAYTKETFVM